MNTIIERLDILEQKQKIVEHLISLSHKISKKKTFLNSISGLGFSNLEKIEIHHIDILQRTSKRLEERYLTL